jgi:hypothetical protein
MSKAIILFWLVIGATLFAQLDPLGFVDGH